MQASRQGLRYPRQVCTRIASGYSPCHARPGSGLTATGRARLSRRGTGAQAAQPSRAGAIAKLRQKRQKLLELYYADKITPTMFADEESRLTSQIDSLEMHTAEGFRRATTTECLG